MLHQNYADEICPDFLISHVVNTTRAETRTSGALLGPVGAQSTMYLEVQPNQLV